MYNILTRTPYLSRWHSTTLPGKEKTVGIDCAIMAFANSSLFVESPAGEYTPFAPISEIRGRFTNGTKLLIAIGGWGDTKGFSEGVKDDVSRKKYAKNVADMVNKHGFDGVGMISLSSTPQQLSMQSCASMFSRMSMIVSGFGF